MNPFQILNPHTLQGGPSGHGLPFVDIKFKFLPHIQSADIGWPTGNGEKLSCTQAQLGQAACLAVA